MNTRKLLLGVVGAAMLMLATTGSASAANLSRSSQTWRATFASAGIRFPTIGVSCSLVLEGSFHSRTMAKVAGSLVGYVRGAVGGSCTSGTIRFLTETLPWHVRYSSFAGTLPTISSLSYAIVGWAFRYTEVVGLNCLYVSTEASPVTFVETREAGGALTRVDLGGSPPGERETCPRLSVTGSTSNYTNEAGARITVTLI
jgi:hypothetical protein